MRHINMKMMIGAGCSVLMVLAVLVTGCVSGEKSRDVTLRVLAGSGLADMEPVLKQAANATGVRVDLDFAGTLEGTEQVLSGRAAGDYDAVWFASNRYLNLDPRARGLLGPSTPIVTSPVIIGARASVAHRLGWDSHRPSWAQIAKAAANRDFTYGMTNPAASNSGFSGLVGVASALNGEGELDVAAIERVAPQLTSFFAAQNLTAGSSGWLSDAFIRNGAEVDGLVNYEYSLLSLNASGKLDEKLTLVYPSDGVSTGDFPLTLLSSAPAAVRDGYQRLIGYLLKPDTQKQIMDMTNRRPIVPEVELDQRFAVRDLKELAFPGTTSTVQTLIAAYFNKIRRPASTIYVLDVSGTMRGAGLSQLQKAMTGLTNSDSPYRFHDREQVTLIPFSTKTAPVQYFTIPGGSPEPELQKIRTSVNALTAGGSTATYDSLTTAYDVARRLTARNPDRFTSIVLLTDGKTNTRGITFAEFSARYPSLAVKNVPVFSIIFRTSDETVDDAAEKNLHDLADLTGGEVFDSRKRALPDVFQEVRGYQ